ncbi:amino acid adenylation domain protein [Actinobacteria bacterium OK074]|nr:amino acid adenylation domain protein [Actinobacteria bacterium OK074]
MTDPSSHGDSAGVIHEIFRRRAAERPDATALVHRGASVSYATLDRASDAFAAELARAGVGAGDIVPLVMPRSPQLVAAILAVLKLGAAYAALDPRWPRPRLAELVDMASAPLVAAAPEHADGWSGPVWTPDADLARAAATDTPPIVSPSRETDTCCVFFTSGSTGRPKGVMSPHSGTVRLFAPARIIDVGPGTVVPQAAALPWDIMSLELWSVLLGGGTSVLIDEPYLTVDGLRDLVRRDGVNTLWLTASLFNMFVEEDLGCFLGVRQLLVGGERLSPPHITSFVQAHPGITLLNGYGPAESAILTTTHRITPADCADGAEIPVGRPVDRTEVFVLDAELRRCPPGSTGEICIAGAGLANGYLANPEQTAESFVEVRVDGATRRVYRTGDLGCLDDDGVLHYLGREDRQVKVRGQRIEPGEIEAHVAQVPGIRRCAIVPRLENGSYVGMIAAYTVAEDASHVSEDDVRAALLERLPAYLVPDVIRAVDAFPLTNNGKLDSAALITMVTAQKTPRAASSPYAQDDSVPSLVARAFSEILGVREVPFGTSFFELGGNSLDGARLCARIGVYTKVSVPASVLITQPTVRELADWVAARAASDERPEQLPADGPLPLLSTQSGFLFDQQSNPRDTSAHCVLVWRVTGGFDPEAFRAAVADVHRRHESLHAAYVFDRRPVAKLPALPAPADFRVHAPVADEHQALDALHAALLRPLDIGKGNTWRCVVVPVAAGGGAARSWALGVVVHHIAFDGSSEQPLAGELSEAYAARLRGRPLDTAPPASLAKVLTGYHAQRNRATLQRQREYWREELSGVPPLSVPGPPESSNEGSFSFRVTAVEVASLDRAAQAMGSTRFAVLLSAYAEALAKVTGDRDFAVGAPVAKRYHPDTAEAISCLIDVVCFRMRPTGDGTLDGLPRLVAGVHSGLAAQDVPFEEVVGLAADPARDRRRHPLFQTLFALQNVPAPELALDGCAVEYVRPQDTTALHELEVEVWPGQDGGAEVVFGYRPETTAAGFVADVTKEFQATLRLFATR